MSDFPIIEENKIYTSKVRNIEKRSLPILDLGPYLSNNALKAHNLQNQLRDIAEDLGFMCIVNHGIQPNILRNIQEEAKSLFDLPKHQKLTLKVDKHERGYLPFRSTVVRKSRYHTEEQIDNYEAFNYGTDYHPNNPHVISGTRLFGENRWPRSTPRLENAALAYTSRMTELALKILPLWAGVFNLSADYFSPYFSNPHSYVRLIHYPPKPDLLTNEYGLGAHSDTCIMTFLPKENEPGIQILDSNNIWFWPEIPDGAIMVNFGQLLERWSNGFVRATPHRVIPPINKHRYSMPFFFSPNLEQKCSCLPTCTDADKPPLYKPVSFQEFHSWYMNRVYKHFEDFDNYNTQ